jgi:soluble cytochrome b562
MKKVESIWAELSAKAQESTELSEVKVELSGLMDELKGKMKEANMDAIRGIDMVHDAERLFNKSVKEQRALVTQFMKALDYAENLGHQGAISEVKKALQQAEQNLKSTLDMIDKLSGF